MEFETVVGDTNNRCENTDNPACVSTKQISNGLNKADSGDNISHSAMKEGYRPGGGNRSVEPVDGGAPCEDMSLDNSRDDSDFSDYSEDNNRCQLANQALRAKLLNGVLNPTTAHESKLRVSVFDHRIIPKKLIIAIKNDNNSRVDIRDNLNENKPKSHIGANVNEQDNAKKRKGSGTSYAVLKAQRKPSSDSVDEKSELTKMDSDNEYRTRFDILLRNLIGDVSGLQVEPSPMTVSSGYESDYVQAPEAEIDRVLHGSPPPPPGGSQDGPPGTRLPTDTPAGYFSLSRKGSDVPRSSLLTDNHQFTSMPSIPTQQSEKPRQRSFENREGSTKNRKEKEPLEFSSAQRNNYKLTKVTRSMYEIIHDLQNGEKPGTEGRKRTRRVRKATRDGNSCSDGSVSAKDNKQSVTKPVDNMPCVRLPSESDTGSLSRPRDTGPSAVSGSVVRCVRRPLGTDSQSLRPAQRKSSHSESNRLASTSSTNDCDKVQNDLRNLLCDTSDVTLSSADNTEHINNFNMVTSGWTGWDRSRVVINGPTDTGCNQADGPITENSPNCPRRPTLNEQFMNRPRPEDHVYETIPGDEKLYEEWKKMRENPKIPKIRRYTTVPDLPGTFIPKEPPALPARRYLQHTTTQPNVKHKESDDYICMGDVNSNFPVQDSNFDPGCLPGGRVLESRLFECYPYTLHDENVFNPPARGDETSDGYCSIDNLSVFRESLAGSPPPAAGEPAPPPPPSSSPRAQLKRSDFFLHSYQGSHNGFNLSSSHLFSERQPASRDPPALLAAPSYSRESVKPVFQATYV